MDAQAAVWNSLCGSVKHVKRSHRRKGDNAQPRDKDKSRQHKHRPSKNARLLECPAKAQPAAQIAPKSYLGSALRNIKCPKKSRHVPGSTSSSSPSSSSEPSSDSSSSNDSSDLSDDDSDGSRHEHQHGKKRRSN